MRRILRGNTLRVAIPCRGADGWIAGEIYLRNVIQCLAALPPANRPAVRIVGDLEANTQFVRDMQRLELVELEPLRAWCRRSRLIETLYHTTNRVLSRALGPDHRLELWGVDLMYPSLQVQSGATRQVYWIPDFQHLRLPAMFSAAEREERTQRQRAIADARGWLILSSEDALRDFREFFPGASVSPRVWRFRSVVSERDRGDPDLHSARGVPQKYLYIANQFWAHKDHLTAFQALRRLKADGLSIPCVCTGQEDDYRNRDHMQTLKRYLREHGLTDQVYFLGLVPRSDQLEIFRHAAGVLQPSRFEGWSTVVEDARALGCSILMSDIEVHKEQAPPAGRYFKVGDDEDLARALSAWWPTLPPGPNRSAEEQAHRESQRLQREAGEALLAILSEAAGRRPYPTTDEAPREV
ncbi:MAG: glycosyltransferase [bacterium]